MESKLNEPNTLLNFSKSPEFTEIQKIKDLLHEKKTDAAFEAVLLALESFSGSAELNYLAACICDAFRTENEAIGYNNKSLELGLKGKSRRDAFLGLASTYRAIGRYPDSKMILQQGIAEFPDYRPYSVFLALTENNLGQSNESIRLLLKQLIETSVNKDIVSYERALNFYSTRLTEIFD